MSDNKFGLRIKWLGCACFEMDFSGVTVVNDPWITPNAKTELTWEAVEKCDYITLTHGHDDHTPDIAIMQVTGGNPADETAKICKEIGCKVVIPHHIDFPKDYSRHVKALGRNWRRSLRKSGISFPSMASGLNCNGGKVI